MRQGGTNGIYFLAEWLDNPMSVRLEAWPYGLPYRLGTLAYAHASAARSMWAWGGRMAFQMWRVILKPAEM